MLLIAYKCTANPTPNPTPRPTNMPTANPTNDFCDIDYTVALGIVVSNGCATTDYTCEDLQEFLSELVESVYNPTYTTLVVFPHALGDDPFSGTREQVLAEIDAMTCGGGTDQIDYDGTIGPVLEDLVDVSSSFDEVKLVVISLCEPEDDDVTCSLPGSIDPDGIVETTVINIGTDVASSDQFACLTDGGTGSPNYNEYDSTDGAIDDIAHLEEEICEEPTPGPTPQPTPNPTPNPTRM